MSMERMDDGSDVSKVHLIQFTRMGHPSLLLVEGHEISEAISNVVRLDGLGFDVSHLGHT